MSFTIISILSGCLTLYGYGMNTGGPVLIVWGWPFVGVMTLFVGLAMAEVCSSFPTAGGLYYWSAKLAPRNAAAWSWFTGWFNFLGQVAVTAGIDFGAALFLNALIDIQWGWDTRPWHTILLFAAILVLHGTLNTFGVRLVALLNNVSVWWHIIGVLLISRRPRHRAVVHQSASFVFTHFVNNTGFSGGSSSYVAAIGLLLAQYTPNGYDASAHMTEETKSAAAAGPRGIVMSIISSLVAGLRDPADRRYVRHPELHGRSDLGATGVPPDSRSSSTRSAPPAASCCLSWSSSRSCSAGCRRSPRTPG